MLTDIRSRCHSMRGAKPRHMPAPRRYQVKCSSERVSEEVRGVHRKEMTANSGTLSRASERGQG